MLEAAARLLKPGGRLLYITLHHRAGKKMKKQISAFLARHPEFHLATDPGGCRPRPGP